MRADVFDHVRPQQVIVVCVERSWPINLDSAYDWIGAVGFDTSSLCGVFPGGIHDDDVEEMYHVAVSTPDIERRWLNCGRVALGRASGRDWWWSLSLIKRCLSGWPYINGKLLLSGVSAAHVSLPDWLDAAYMLLWQGCDENERTKLDLELSMPPAGVAYKQSKAAKEKMLADFAAD